MAFLLRVALWRLDKDVVVDVSVEKGCNDVHLMAMPSLTDYRTLGTSTATRMCQQFAVEGFQELWGAVIEPRIQSVIRECLWFQQSTNMGPGARK
jgi:hypothetical protein